ncbi:MAG: hypothetical protein GXX90_10315 [Microbacteriaceae bacterium]|nr:hypothetical protein [Microbacteriaceae bacterium]
MTPATPATPGRRPSAGPPHAVPLAARLRAVVATDLVDGAVVLVAGFAALLALWAITAWQAPPEPLRLGSPAEAWALAALAAALIGCADAAPGRREALLGGWTRREQLEVLGVKALVLVVVAAIGHIAVIAASPAMRRLLQDRFGAPLQLRDPELGLAGTAVLVLAVLVMCCAPLALTMLSRRHWLLVVLAAPALIALQQAALPAYAAAVHPEGAGGAPAAGAAWLAPLLLTAAMSAAIVVGTVVAARREPVRRYRE